MHIPDGYLSPSTCLVFGAAMVPVWGSAVRRVRARLGTRDIPLMALGAAFCFTVMMYNIPLPGGTTAHAAGGALLAVVLGPWAASICLSVALAIQALLFGDGGIWSFGANCFTMAFVLPFASWGVYRLVAGRSPLRSARRWVGAALGGFVGLNAAALVAATALGLQPLLFHTPGGTPLYCPYSLGIALPAMMIGHLGVAGPLEGLVTALVVRYLQANEPDLLDPGAAEPQRAFGAGLSRSGLWGGLGALLLLTPLGLLARGTAWGEWSSGELGRLLAYVPSGLERLSASRPGAPFPDYSLPAAAGGTWSGALLYVLCALLGAAAVAGLMFLLGRLQAAEEGALPDRGEGRRQ